METSSKSTIAFAAHDPVIRAVTALLTLVGLGLRVASAHGGLWLDEAWSAVFARDAATPLTILFGMPHDNNHYLNTLWLQLIGWDASPLLQRGLSIAAGTAAIPVAALIGARRGTVAAVAAAMLFALSPILVTYGSEARGYAPMILMILLALFTIGHWLDAPDESRPPSRVLAITLLLAILAQLTAFFAIAALFGWIAIVRWRQAGLRRAIRDTASAMAPALLLCMGFVSIVLFSAWLEGGFRMGGYAPFDWTGWANALGAACGYALGWDPRPEWAIYLAIVVATIAAVVLNPILRSRGPFLLLSIIAFPLTVAVLQLANSGLPRYYLVVSIALLLLCTGLANIGWSIGRGMRLAILIGGAAFLIGAVRMDVSLIRNQRGDPARAIAAMASIAPDGATVMVEQPRSSAVITVAAATAGYKADVVAVGCPARRFLYVGRDGSAPFPASPMICGQRFRPIASGMPTGLSGNPWRLYERVPKN